MGFNFGLKTALNSVVGGFSVATGEAAINRITFPEGTTYFETPTHKVYVITSSTTMTIEGTPTFSYWNSGAGGTSAGGCFGHAGVGGGGAGGVDQVTDDTFSLPAGEYNCVVPGKGGGNTYFEDSVTSTQYAIAYKGGGGNQGNGGPGGCGGGGGNQ